MTNGVDAKTQRERQTSYNAAKMAKGFVKVNMWLKTDTLSKIKELSTKGDITQGEVVDQLLAKEQ